MSALVLWINIPLLLAAAFGLWVGAPVWLSLHHPRDNHGRGSHGTLARS